MSSIMSNAINLNSLSLTQVQTAKIEHVAIRKLLHLTLDCPGPKLRTLQMIINANQ